MLQKYKNINRHISPALHGLNGVMKLQQFEKLADGDFRLPDNSAEGAGGSASGR